MNDYKKSRGRLLTASSLALAAILTMGAGTGWAGNITAPDGSTAVGGEGAGVVYDNIVPGAVVAGAGQITLNTGVTAAEKIAALPTTDTVRILGTAGTVAQISGTDANGNIVTSGVSGDKKAGHLEVGDEVTVNISGVTGGNIGDITGLGDSVFQAEGSLVSTGQVSDITFTIDPSIVGVETVVDSNVGVGMRSVMLVHGNPNNAYADWIKKETWAQPLLNTLGVNGKTLAAMNQDTSWMTGLNYHTNINKGLANEAASPFISSVLAISEATVIGADKAYRVDGSLGNAALEALVEDGGTQTETLRFEANSLFVVDAAGVGPDAALTATAGTRTEEAVIHASSSLYIVNARVGDTKLLEGFTDGVTAGAGGWTAVDGNGDYTNLRLDTRLFDREAVVIDSTTTAGTVTVNTDNAYIGAKAAYGKISNGTAQLIDSIYTTNNDDIRNDVDHDNAGIRFVSRAVNENFLDYNKNNGKRVVATLEGAEAMASVAGVQTGSFSISNTIVGNYNARLSYLRDTAPAAGSEPGSVAVWINPFYNFSDVDGVKIGSYEGEYEINYGGATIGVDTNVNENFRLGLAVSVGGGDTESKGSTFNKTESDLDFWGIGVYGSYTNGMFGLTGDIGYSGASYDIDQRQTIANKFTADVDTDTFTIGLNGEYRFMTENCLNIIPHVGIRYTNMKTDSYRVKEKGRGTVFNVSSDKQNIWTFPVGVTFTGDVDTNSGWTIKPMADLGVIFAAGDLDADSKYRVPDTNHRGKITADDVVDAVTFNGLVGLKADAGNGFSVGLDYNLKASDNLTSHGVTGMIRYEF